MLLLFPPPQKSKCYKDHPQNLNPLGGKAGSEDHHWPQLKFVNISQFHAPKTHKWSNQLAPPCFPFIHCFSTLTRLQNLKN